MSDRPVIFLALATYTNISNVLRGQLLPALAERYRVVVLTPFIDGERATRAEYFIHENIRYVCLPLAYGWLWRWSHKYGRTAFVRQFDDIAMTSAWYYRPELPKRTRLVIALGSFLPRWFPTARHFSALEALIARPTDEFRTLVERYKPALLVTATPGYYYAAFEAEILTFARHLGIPSVAVDLSFDNPFSQPKYARLTGYACVWSDRMRRDLLSTHDYAPERVAAVGCLKFDHYFTDEREGRVQSREEFLRAKSLNPRKKLLVLATPTPNTYPPRVTFLEQLLAAKRSGALAGDPNILVRLHPLDKMSDYMPFHSLPGVSIEKAGEERVSENEIKGTNVEMTERDLINTAETLRYADALINYASTMIVEACIFNTPTVSIGFPAAQRPLIDVEVTRDFMALSGEPIAQNFDELLVEVNRFLTTEQSAEDFARDRRTVDKFIQFTDGRSWERTAAFIDSIILKTTPA